MVGAMSEQPRLTKSTTDRMLCGVAEGIAEYLAVDATLVRLAFLVAACCGGLGIVVYLVACAVMPPSGTAPAAAPADSSAADHAHN